MEKTKIELQSQKQDEALASIGDEHNVGIAIGTGGGKTLLGLKHMAKQYHDSISFLVAAPTKSIFIEWTNQAMQHGLEFLLPHITFTTYRSLPKQRVDYDWLYLDECHSLKHSHSEYLDELNSKGGKILGLSGTYPAYASSEKGVMCNQYCRKIFEYNIDEAIEDGMLNNYTIYVHMLKLSNFHTVEKKTKTGTFKTSEVKDQAYYDSAITRASSDFMKQRLIIGRMKSLQSYQTKVDYIKKILPNIPYKVLVFANTKKQADEISKYSYHSSNKNSEHNLQLFADNKIKELSCVDQLSEGKNIPNLRAGIIMHTFSNERKLRQKVGRFLRLNPDESATIHVLCYEDSVDLRWVQNSLKYFDADKIKTYRPQ